MGYPGAGKTFFARQFTDQYNIPYISEDRVRFELFEKPQFNDDEQEIIGRISEYTVEQVMKTKSTLVFDGHSATQSSRKRLFDLAGDNGYKTLLVWLQTDINTSASRSKRRDRRNADSKYSFELDDLTFKRISSSLQRPNEKQPSVVISGKHAFKGQSLTVLRKIADMHAQAATAGTPTETTRHGAPLLGIKPRPGQRLIQ
jgi:predicted kinase